MKRLALMGWFLVAGCTSDFDPAQHLDGLRILGVIADPPEVAGGDKTTLAPIVVDTRGEMVTIDWAACTEMPGPSGGRTNPDCVNNDTAPYLIPLGQGTTLSAMLPSVPRALFGTVDGSGGVYLPIRMKAQSTSDQLTAVYHLRINFGETANQNPELAGWYQNEGTGMPLDEKTPIDVHTGDVLTMHASFTDGSDENYTFVDASGVTQMQTETLTLAWFCTAGTFSNDSTGPDVDLTWTADKYLPSAGTIIDLYVVGRDERGGTDYLHRTLRMQ